MKQKLLSVFPLMSFFLLFAASGAADSQNILGINVESSKKYVVGVEIISVAPDSPCRSVLNPTDVIVELNPNGDLTGFKQKDKDYQVIGMSEFQALVSKIQPGASATFMLYSGKSSFAPGRKVSCTIPADAKLPALTASLAPAPQAAFTAPSENQNILGITVDHSPKGNGVEVKTVAPASPCQGVLSPGDIIYALNPNGGLTGMRGPDTPYLIASIDSFIKQVSKIHPGSNVTFSVSGRKASCVIPMNAQANPAAQPQPASSTPTPQPASAPPLENQNILGISVERMPKGNGVEVKTVAPDSPCQSVLRPGDIIYLLNPNSDPMSMIQFPNEAYEIRDLNSFLTLVSQIHPGSKVSLITAEQFGHLQSCVIPMNAQTNPPAPTQPASPPASPQTVSAPPLENQNILGITVEQRPKGNGVLVKTVSPGSPCQSALKPGNIIYAMNPNGDLGGGMRENDMPFYIWDLNSFRTLVAKINPGSNVTFLASGFRKRCVIPINAQTNQPAPPQPASPEAKP